MSWWKFERRTTIVQRWALAAGANLTQARLDGLNELASVNPRAEMKQSLAQSWSMHGPEDVHSTMMWLRQEGHSVSLQNTLRDLARLPDSQFEAYAARVAPELQHRVRFARQHRAKFKNGTLLAWDMVRLSFIARASYSVGWLARAAAWEVVLEAAQKLQSGYGSWAELSDNYLIGRCYWGESPKSHAIFVKHAAWLVRSSRSPWQQLPWDLPLTDS